MLFMNTYTLATMINECLEKFLYDNYLQNGETLVKYRFSRDLHRQSQMYRFYITLIVEDSNGIWRDINILLGTTSRNS